MTTTPNGVPITVCATCHREHPMPSLFDLTGDAA